MTDRAGRCKLLLIRKKIGDSKETDSQESMSPKKTQSSLKVIPLGGLGEIGLNMMVLEYDHYLLVVDAGLMFPEEYMPGVDLVIPDFQYLKDHQDEIKSIILTCRSRRH